MGEVSEYRFLPWTRRGLSARLDHVATTPARADVAVGVTVTGAAPASLDLTLYGPGDVLGLDTRLIVRTEPRANVTDVEPNYMPAVDFELPDLPWMFTPTGPTTDQHLPPWLVLICVDAAKVDPPRVEPGTPLPRITIPGDVAAEELPDLADSYAWAHTQVVRGASEPAVTGGDLAADPAANVSRLVCPRHLEAGRRYHACLVPAFDVGVVRGLTGQVPEQTTAGPAWGTSPGETTLPVYYHWTFATGPAGDFETLARRLRPVECPPEVGAAPMFVGAAGRGLPGIPAEAPGGILEMDGALRSVERESGTLANVPDALEEGLRRAVNAVAERAAEAEGDTDPIGPPLYGGLHLDRTRVAETGPGFLRELNTDPRRRAAAGVGAALVRHEQEDMVHQAWEQVGDVLEANELLSRAALMEQVLERLHERHLRPLPGDRVLQIAGPSLHRVLFNGRTGPHELRQTSLPQQAFDSGLRRQLAPTNRLLRTARAVAGVHEGIVGSSVVAGLAEGHVTVDPNHGFTPDGIAGVRGAEDLPRPGRDGGVDLGPIGFDVRVPGELVESVRAASDGDRPTGGRADLLATGIVTDAHVEALTRANADELAGGGTATAIASLRDATARHPDAVGFLAGTGDAQGLAALELRAGELVRLGADGERTVIARISERLTARPDVLTLPAIVGALEPKALAARARGDVVTLDLDGADIIRLPDVPPGRGGRVPFRPLDDDVIVIDDAIPDGGRGRRPGPSRGGGSGRGREPSPVPERREEAPVAVTSNTVPAPIRTTEAVARFSEAFDAVLTTIGATPTAPEAVFVPFDLDSARATVIEQSAPSTVVPSRTRARLAVGDVSLFDIAEAGHFLLPHTADRIWAEPDLETPLYELLARYDRDRFLPGVEVIPPNAITLVETNPHFIESFLVGVNDEFNRELLWRGYPTDQRGTSMRFFWDWTDGGADIEHIHTWHPNSRLGTHARGSGQGNVVLLVRGDLLRRYPNASVYAWRAEGDELKQDPTEADLAVPVFAGRFDPDFTFAGFELTQDQLDDGDGWFFVIAEQPTEPRFGMDELTGRSSVTPPAISSWAELSWASAAVEPGAHLRLSATPLTTEIEGLRLGGDAAQFAAITLQRPFQAAIHARHMVAGL